MSRRPRPPHRTGAFGAALVVSGLGAAVLLGACSDLVAGDGASVTAQLCEQLGACYGRDRYACDAMDRTLRQASVEERDGFLSGYEEDACLESCPGSLACLDNEPFCTRGGGCADETDCCNWSLGLAACAPASQTCCSPRGVACSGPDAAPCCDAACENGYCGGTACALVGQTCRRDDECCTRRCDDGVCAAKTCAALGAPCLSDGDCCSPPGPGTTAAEAVPQAVCDPTDRVCVLAGPVCAQAGDPCDPNGTGLGCCADQGLVCGAGPGGGVCGAPGCLGLGSDCAFDVQCCGGTICDYDLGAVCATVPVACCGKAGAPCADDAGCCPGRTCTEAGFCSEVGGPTCAPGMCHSPFLVGGAMAVGACAGTADACCVDLVAQSDSFCSCIAWDLVCADKAALDCPAACP